MVSKPVVSPTSKSAPCIAASGFGNLRHSRLGSLRYAKQILCPSSCGRTAREVRQAQKDQTQVQRAFGWRTGDLNGSLPVLLFLLRCLAIIENARFSPQVGYVGGVVSMPSSQFKMKTSSIPALFLALVLIGYAVFLASTISLLPQRMATHFDASGQPNGWMGRSSAVVFQGIAGLVLPLIITAVFYTIRFLPPQWINLPRRDFWFSPERREKTCTYLSRQGLWLASLLVGLAAVVWCQLIESNSASIPHLSSSEFLVTIAAFGGAMIVWVITIFRHFANAA
jgi:hypothetical protein